MQFDLKTTTHAAMIASVARGVVSVIELSPSVRYWSSPMFFLFQLVNIAFFASIAAFLYTLSQRQKGA